MTTAALEYIANRLQENDIPYAFMRWSQKPLAEVYFVGEYLETPTPTRPENGHQQSTFILRGFTRNSWLFLEEAKETIARVLPAVVVLEDGNGLCITYDTAQPVPTGDSEIKSIKMDFAIDEWSVK